MAVPKLRFKEFDADYTNTTFEKLKGFSIQSGKSEEKGDTGEFPFYGSTGVIGYKDIFDYEGKSILIARVGANAGSLYQIDGKYSVSDNTLRLTVSDDTSLDYLRELLIKFNLNRLVFGTGQPLVTGGMIKKVNIFIPEFTEQTKIASFLSNVDEKISQLTQKHALLSQYKQGMMQKLFSQQIRFKADDGSEFGEWGKAKVGNITETIFGYPFDSKEMVEDNNGIPLMRGINIGECHIRHSFELDRFFLKDTSKLEKYFVRVNDIVLSMDGSKVGRNSAFVTEKDAGSLLVQRVCILREKENTNIQYVYQWIISKEFHRYVDQVKTSSGIPHISGKQIQDYEISYPCLEEQTKIASFLSSIDQKIEVVAQQIEQAKTWKKGLLQQMFI